MLWNAGFCLINISLIHTSGTDSSPCVILSLIRSTLHYWLYPSIYYFAAVMIQFPLEGSCYSSLPLFPCCSWKRICTIRVSWDCVVVIVIQGVTLRAQYSHVVCELFQWVWGNIWTYFTSIQIFQKYLFFCHAEIIIHASNPLATLCKENNHIEKLYIVHTVIIPAVFAMWHCKLKWYIVLSLWSCWINLSWSFHKLITYY